MGRNRDLGRVREARPVRSARADNARIGLEIACVELVLLVEEIRSTCHGAWKTATAAEKCGTVGNAASETTANTQGTVCNDAPTWEVRARGSGTDVVECPARKQARRAPEEEGAKMDVDGRE
ncbi:hypothetical protein PR003_g28769 [Phytophthora rubi]|uniref:Uncharacterized protein n=1 Tax=Phytophthora rubi TaxID=129364 RepID=A0A6A3GYI7_9STRA|nr:hypothetical protein PR002_g29714 [Phytophthora rubi]KAE8975311.1 hypothetical protein PR001_g25742 [Phytophthora rubi]KAE9277516.1 hypothetical protein PR003_g28769 [Phytophthora rubi]